MTRWKQEGESESNQPTAVKKIQKLAYPPSERDGEIGWLKQHLQAKCCDQWTVKLRPNGVVGKHDLKVCDYAIEEMLQGRFWFVGVFGTALAMFGVVSNALLAVLFLSRFTYRHSPFFFLGFVALYDTLLDFTYIILLPVPTVAEYFNDLAMYDIWLHYVRPAYLFGQISKISSVFCLIVASFERYFITRHWTFMGFEQRTRWLILVFVVLFAISLKLATFTDIVILKLPMCDRFRRYKVGSLSDNVIMSGLFNIVSIFLPFITLVFLNGGIVMMLRKQHIQQLRSLITELTMGPDIMKLRRSNIRSATNTLIVIITAYLISNMLNMMITLFEFFWPDFLHNEHRQLYRIATDTASVLTVVGNAIRCPAHLVSNKDIRQHFGLMLFGENNKVVIAPRSPRRSSQKVEAPWISLLIVPDETPPPNLPTHSFADSLRRLSASIALRYGSASPVPSIKGEYRRNTFCYGNRLTIPESETLIELIERMKNDESYHNNNSLSSNSNGVIMV